MKQIIYVYTTETYKYKNWYKIGMTNQDTASVRISQQDGTSNPEKLEIVYEIDISNETDLSAYEVEQKLHRYYDKLGKRTRDNREWFEIDGGLEEIKGVIESILDNYDLHKSEIVLKPHQIEANSKINECFNSDDKRCLLAHKPRSGKTFTTIYNIKENNYKNVVILTSYPILNFQWEEVILESKGFSNSEIIIGSGTNKIELDPQKNSIVLLSLQDVKGGEEVFEKQKFSVIKDIQFDLLVIDEVHYGVETEKTQDFLNKIKYKRMLGLSATPTRNLLCGRFSKEQIHNYTLVEEVKLKKQYPELYPYADINFLIWNLSSNEKSDLKYFSDEEQFKFDKFFRIDGDNFYYKSDIVYLFKKLTGDRDICRRDKLGTSYPFQNRGRFSEVKSILLFVPNIDVQYKLKELLDQLESYDDFNIHITNSVEYSSKDLMKKIKRDFKSGDKRSLILAVDQLTTGITLNDCDMVAMMNDWKSIDKYIQASFRCQSPRKGKQNCWVLDFNAARSFELMWEYQNIISKNNGKSLSENIWEWVECVNIFNRIEGEMIQVDFDGFNNEYNKAVLEKPRFNYGSVILHDKLVGEVGKKLLNIGIKGGSSSSDVDLNRDGIDSGKGKKYEKTSSIKEKVDDSITSAKLEEIARALVDKTMLLNIFTYFRYDNVDDCFNALKNDNTVANGIGELERKMYLDTLLLGMNDIDKIELSDIKFIYDRIYNKEIINKKMYLFNQNVNLIYNSVVENPEIIGNMLKNLMELIDSYLKPSNTEKKMLGEVFTSLKLVEEMLDKLPKEVWSDPNLKWLDPANGIGNFPVIIVKNLMEGLKEWQPDSELRLKYILENMIYVCELQSKNMFIYLQLFDPQNKYNMNFYRGSFLDEGFSEVMKEWRVEKFDIVVGNPPYQESNENGKTKTGGANLYTKFIRKSFDKLLKDKGYLLFITPPTWMNTGSNEIDIFSKNQIVYLNIEECSKYFPNVGSKFSYFNIKKDNIINETKIICKFNNYIYESEILLKDFNYLPMLLDKRTLDIYEKMSKYDKNDFNILFKFDHRRDFISKNKDDEYVYKLKHTSKQYRYSKVIHPAQKNKKVLFARSGNLSPEYDNGNLGATDGIMWILVDNEISGKNMISIFTSKIFKFILTVYKWNGFNDVTILKNLPKLDLSKSWTDGELYQHFNLTTQEIQLIEQTIQE